MKLIPQSKPVRIRIKSGGIEHSSLSTLRDHFDIIDIYKVCQSKSILRWLEQQNESKVLEKVNEAIAIGPNDETLYDIKLILAFFPEAEKEGINTISGILSFWAKHNYFYNIQHYIHLVNNAELIEGIQNSPIQKLSILVKERLGMIHSIQGLYMESAKYGNKEALKKIKQQLPEFTSSYSYEDIKSFSILQKKAKSGKIIIKTENFTPQVEKIASLVSLFQFVLMKHHDIDNMCITLRSNPLISKREWPKALQDYVFLLMRAIRRYIGIEGIRKWAKSVGALRYTDGSYDTTGLSMANTALLETDDEAKSKMAYVKTGLFLSLIAIRKHNAESFSCAIAKIFDYMLRL